MSIRGVESGLSSMVASARFRSFRTATAVFEDPPAGWLRSVRDGTKEPAGSGRGIPGVRGPYPTRTGSGIHSRPCVSSALASTASLRMTGPATLVGVPRSRISAYLRVYVRAVGGLDRLGLRDREIMSRACAESFGAREFEDFRIKRSDVREQLNLLLVHPSLGKAGPTMYGCSHRPRCGATWTARSQFQATFPYRRHTNPAIPDYLTERPPSGSVWNQG